MGGRGDWMQTYSGRQYWPLDPRAADVNIYDIAHHLAMICRFCGACKRHYSVAEHSYYVSLLVSPELALHGLLHDAAEAYCNDIVRPVKRHLPGYAEIEARNEAAIACALGLRLLTATEREHIKVADNAILLAEQALIMAPAPASWAPLDVPRDLRARAYAMLETTYQPRPLNPPEAKYPFIRRWYELKGTPDANRT